MDKNLKTVLMIDDDATLARFLARYVEKYGYKLVHAGRPEDGLRELEKGRPVAVLLDINLPGMSGLEVCRAIRERNPVPIVMISALTETSDRVLGLETGADDYLPKPFEPRELVAHLDALLRRVERLSAPPQPTVIQTGGLRVDLDRHEVSVDDRRVAISSAEFQLLSVFVSRPGHLFSRDELLNELRGIDWDAYNRSVDVLVSRLRRKLGDSAKTPRFLKTVWGSGYLFVPQDPTRKAG